MAESIGKPAASEDVKALLERHPELVGTITIPKIESTFQTTREEIALELVHYRAAPGDFRSNSQPFPRRPN